MGRGGVAGSAECGTQLDALTVAKVTGTPDHYSDAQRF